MLDSIVVMAVFVVLAIPLMMAAQNNSANTSEINHSAGREAATPAPPNDKDLLASDLKPATSDFLREKWVSNFGGATEW